MLVPTRLLPANVGISALYRRFVASLKKTNLYQNSRLDRMSIFRGGVAGTERVTFSKGGCSFYIKNKLKSEILNDKKKFVHKNVFLS